MMTSGKTSLSKLGLLQILYDNLGVYVFDDAGAPSYFAAVKRMLIY